MKNTTLLLILVIQINVFSQAKTLIKSINIIDVKTGNISLSDILIEGKRIKKIAKDIKKDNVTYLIDGRDKWLTPGLVDSHIHLFQSGGIYTRPDGIDLQHHVPYEIERKWLIDNVNKIFRSYLRCGITSLIDVGGPLYNLKIRDTYKDSLNYPSLFITGPLISSYQPKAFEINDAPIIKVKEPNEARALVRKQLPFNPDFIKIWYIVRKNESPIDHYEMVKAAIDESHKYHLKVAVHATELETAKLAIKAGADFLVHSVDDEKIDQEFLELINVNKVSYIPTFVVSTNYSRALQLGFVPSNEELMYSPQKPLSSLLDNRFLKDSLLRKRNPEQLKKYLEYKKKIQYNMRYNLRLLADNKINIATGTDAGNIGTLHGASYYDELEAMRNAGLSNIELLQASTINGAKILNMQSQFGSIEEGKLADLLILKKNPLIDIMNLKEMEYVINKGVVMPANTILKFTSEDLVDQQLNGYNYGNIDAFLEPYSEDIEVYDFPNNLRYKGKNKMREKYQSFFNKYPELFCHVSNRMVLGNKVIDYEEIYMDTNSSKPDFYAIAVYTIESGKIAKVCFLRDK